MKKLLLLLIPFLAACASKPAEDKKIEEKLVEVETMESNSLKASFDRFCNAAVGKGVNKKETCDVMPLTKDSTVCLTDVTIIKQYISDEKLGQDALTEILDVVNKDIPLTLMINGANNHEATVFVFARELGQDNQNEFLLVSSQKGMFNCMIYGITDSKTVKYIQDLPLEMEKENMRIPLVGDGNDKFLIDMRFNDFNFNGVNFNQ